MIVEEPHLDCVGPGDLGVVVLDEEGVVVVLALAGGGGVDTEDSLARLGVAGSGATCS